MICHELIKDNIIKLNCGHVYHASCYGNYRDSAGEGVKCPICKKPQLPRLLSLYTQTLEKPNFENVHKTVTQLSKLVVELYNTDIMCHNVYALILLFCQIDSIKLIQLN